jgi:hypothetical protein
MLKKKIYSPQVQVIVLGSSELSQLFPGGTISPEALNLDAELRVQRLGENAIT